MATVLLLAGAGCGPRITREERIERLRSQYAASLESLVVKQDPVATQVGGGAVAGAAERALPVVRTEAILDIRVSTRAETYLAGLTLDVQQLDAQRRPKARSTVWVDTSAVTRDGAGRVSHVLENVDWDTGDRFSVEVRTPIPPAERSRYREFEREGR